MNRYKNHATDIELYAPEGIEVHKFSCAVRWYGPTAVCNCDYASEPHSNHQGATSSSET